MTFFSVNHLSAGYGKNNVLSDVCFSLDEGEIIGVLGANGCGKTTLLKCICGILPHDGQCTLSGENIDNLPAKQIAQKCSYIPQRSGLAIDISVFDVVMMGFNPKLRLFEYPDEKMKKAGEDALAMVGLFEKKDDNYMTLSEGQKQLCIIARTLVSGAKLLLLDEPESALDFKLRYKTFLLLKEWIKNNKSSAIVTLHDSTLALNYCDQLLLLDDGKVLCSICPKTDSVEYMEKMLSQIYGKVSLQKCCTKDGNESIVMIKEED